MEGFAHTDCHFFISGSCTKGPSCPYRHNETAKQTTAVCTSWRGGGFCSLKCSYRHPDKRFMGAGKVVATPAAAPAAADRSQTPCHYFAQGQCRFGAQCQFKHEGVEAVSLHAQARNQEQQAPPPVAPTEPKKGGESTRALEILSKFSASNKATARGGSVTVRSAMPPSAPKETGNGQGLGTLSRGGGGGSAPQVLRPSGQAPSTQPRQPAFQAGPSASAAEKRKEPSTSTAPRLLTLSKSNTSVSSSQSGKADFEIPSFEEIIAAKRRKEAAERKAPTAATPTLTKPPVFHPAPSAAVKQAQVAAPVAAVRPVAPVAAVPQVEVPEVGAYLDSDLPSYDEDDDGVFEEYRDLI